MLYQRIFDQLEIYAPEIYEIFQISRILEEKEISDYQSLMPLFEQTAEPENLPDDNLVEPRKNSSEQEWHVDVMRKLQDFPKILKKEFMLPDEIFDQKLISKELLVRQPDVVEEFTSWDKYFERENRLDKEKKEKRQSTYILLDVSGTTASHNRLLLEKAIAMQFIISNHRDKGTIYLRLFNHDVSGLIISTNGEKTKHFWSELFRPFAPFGGTNLQRGLETAFNDIAYHSIDPNSEILVLTDGLTVIDTEKLMQMSEGTKINFVIIGDDRLDLTEIELREIYDKSMIRWKKKWEKKLEKKEFEAHLEQMEKKFWANRYDEQDKYYRNIIANLEKLSEETGGIFLQIPDLPKTVLASPELIKSLREELKNINFRLNEDIPVSEKENILERLISLKNYINSIVQSFPSMNPEYKESLDIISEGIKNQIVRDEELLEMLQYIKIKVKFGSAQADREISMAELFKILFVKLRTYFLRYRA